LLALTNARVEATQQLDVLMRGRSDQIKAKSLRRQLLIGLVISAFLVGMLWGWYQKPDFLLQVESLSSTQVVQKETVKEQFWFASLMSNQEPLKEEALRSVRKFFSPQESKNNERYARLADQKLADLYLEQGRLTEANKLYKTLADLPASEQQLRVFGLVGQANIHQRRQEGLQAADKLTEVRVIYDDLILSLRREVQQRMNPELRKEFTDLPPTEGSNDRPGATRDDFGPRPRGPGRDGRPGPSRDSSTPGRLDR